MASKRLYAHSVNGAPVKEWQTLEEHLENVAHLAKGFAKKFSAEQWGYCAGLLHDLGKASESFQAYLLNNAKESDVEPQQTRGTDHSSAGAQIAVARYGLAGHILAYCISGHHAGLLDAVDKLGYGASLEGRLKKSLDPCRYLHIEPLLPKELGTPLILERAFERCSSSEAAFSASMFVRMLFSCLVDADFLDTERFLDARQASQRPSWPDSILKEIAQACDLFVEQDLSPSRSRIGKERQRIRTACLQKAELPPGFFSLTVPTGGGKTLSSLAFGLRHALSNGLQRVVYVLPYTSIIEQNAEVFRRVTRPLVDRGIVDPVVEHHSNISEERDTIPSRLASENWAAPIVVTTTVQFYEALFSNRPSQCRRLHNISRSVVILDEVQKLPVDYLKPCLMALRGLTTDYGTSVLLCTATQPSFHKREDFEIGIEIPPDKELAPDPPRLYTLLRRAKVEHLGKVSDVELVGLAAKNNQSLIIANTRRHARILFEELKDSCRYEQVFHLSAAMCPEHRSSILGEVFERLKQDEPCLVVSTQLIEAGIDIDFPVVFRSMAGLDSIAQAAGRCNRNGREPLGTTYVFRSEHEGSERFLRETAQVASELMGAEDKEALFEDILSLEAVEHYFRLYYWTQRDRWDSRRILDELHLQNKEDLPFLFNFRSISERFRLIDESQKPVVIPWQEQGIQLCRRLEQIPGGVLVPRDLRRALQRYTVQVRKRLWDQHVYSGDIRLVNEQYPVLAAPDIHYHDSLGLILEDRVLEEDQFIV